MSSFAKTLLAVVLAGLTITPVASAQSGLSGNMEDELYAMSSQAGVIFAGQVLAVRPQLDLAYGSASGWVEIEFRIDQSIRGCVGQATYVLREWSGLWSGGRQRYTVGQRLLMLLHSPGASGLSSPVGGLDGAIPLTGAGASPRLQDGFVTAAEQAVDLRWIEARLLRSTTARSQTTVHPGISASLEPVYAGRANALPLTTKAARALRSSVTGPVRIVGPVSSAGFESPITVPLNGTASRGLTLRSVLAMFEAWQAEQTNGTH